MKEKFDLIDCCNFPYFPIFTCKIYSLIKRKPLKITWHEVWDKYWFEYIGEKGIFGYIIEKIAAKIPDECITVSNYTYKKLRKLRKGSIKTIINGICFSEIEKITSAKKKYDILFAGRLIKEKNVDLIIDAVGTKYNVGIIGDGPELARLKNKAPKNFTFLGFFDDINEVYALMKSAKVFAFPSLREGFGISVIEANACGCPVIVVDNENNASKELIYEGINGYISQNNPHDYINNIEKAMKVIDRKRCQETAKQYDWDKIVDQIEEVYMR